jgi:VWFA-related protein
MKVSLRRSHLPLFAALGVLVLAAGVLASSPQGATDKHVYVTVFDSQNKPVTGLPAEAFAIREDNLDREIVKVAPATEPVALVLLADTTSSFTKYVRDLRVATQSFVKYFFEKNPGSSLSLWEFGGADIPIVDFTTDAAKLDTAATKLFPKGSMSEVDRAGAGSTLSGQNIMGSALLEGIISASKKLAKRPETRRVIFGFNADAAVEVSSMPGKQVQDEVQKAGTQLFAVSLQEGANNGPLRDNVLGQLCPLSGGKRFTILDISSLEQALKNVADAIAGQYVVTYKRPSGAARQVQVGIRREGLKAYAAGWAPK